MGGWSVLCVSVAGKWDATSCVWCVVLLSQGECGEGVDGIGESGCVLWMN